MGVEMNLKQIPNKLISKKQKPKCLIPNGPHFYTSIKDDANINPKKTLVMHNMHGLVKEYVKR